MAVFCFVSELTPYGEAAAKEKRCSSNTRLVETVGIEGQAPRICFANSPILVPRAPLRRTARDGRWVRSPLHFNKRKESRKSYSLFFGGDGEDRTHDLLTASQTLSGYT